MHPNISEASVRQTTHTGSRPDIQYSQEELSAKIKTKGFVVLALR